MNSLRLIVHGRVQGVGYRDWLAQTARALGVHGWVRNLTDGTVEAVISGRAGAVQACFAACHDGPPLAEVIRIESTACDPPDRAIFEKKTTAER
ncbi:acylphosphatase [Acidocella sp.]|uniref:acylphosphatase n=1 Tax=Acidocella sp. TaxID=50710 RepID=UPI003D0780C6